MSLRARFRERMAGNMPGVGSTFQMACCMGMNGSEYSSFEKTEVSRWVENDVVEEVDADDFAGLLDAAGVLADEVIRDVLLEG